MNITKFRPVITAALGLALAAGLGAAAGLGTELASTPLAAQASTQGGTITRSEVLARAQDWVDRGITYTQTGTWASDVEGDHTYRRDCSGLVSMAWHLSTSYVTGDFLNGAGPSQTLASLNDLKPGDAMVKSGHIELFAAWKNTSDHTQGAYVYSFNTEGETVRNPYANSNYGNLGYDSWSELNTYSPIRYIKIIDDVVAGSIPTGTLADISLDGKKDVLAQGSDGKLIVYPGTGTGGFGASYVVGTGFTGVDSVTVADFTSDGRPDLLVRFPSSGDLKLYTHTGNASQPYTGGGTTFGTGWNGWTINAADLNLDGKTDILAGAGDGSLYVYPGDGAGGLGTRYLVGTGWTGWNINVADVTLDGKPDLVARNVAGEIKLFAHTGNVNQPYVGNGTIIGTGFSGMNAIMLGDFNGDGKADLITRVTSTGDLRMYPHNGNVSSPYAGTPSTIGTGWNGMVDLD